MCCNRMPWQDDKALQEKRHKSTERVSVIRPGLGLEIIIMNHLILIPLVVVSVEDVS